jgi:hypothetical protein
MLPCKAGQHCSSLFFSREWWKNGHSKPPYMADLREELLRAALYGSSLCVEKCHFKPKNNREVVAQGGHKPTLRTPVRRRTGERRAGVSKSPEAKSERSGDPRRGRRGKPPSRTPALTRGRVLVRGPVRRRTGERRAGLSKLPVGEHTALPHPSSNVDPSSTPRLFPIPFHLSYNHSCPIL